MTVGPKFLECVIMHYVSYAFYMVWVWLDAFLIAPYRWPEDPVWGLWLGTAVLAFWAVALGGLTMKIVYKINSRHVAKTGDEVSKMHEASMNALRSGDKEAWRGINKLGNEAFGKAFFLNIAMGASSLWPAFFAAAWLRMRFEEVLFPTPFGGINYAAGFIVLYIPLRVLLSLGFKRLGPNKKKGSESWKTFNKRIARPFDKG